METNTVLALFQIGVALFMLVAIIANIAGKSGTFGWGVFFATMLILNLFGGLSRLTPSYHKMANDVIEQCEANLPRTVTCKAVITAEPMPPKETE